MQLRVPRQARVANAVVLQVREGDVAVERAQQVLRGHAVARLVEENRHELVRPVLFGRLLCVTLNILAVASEKQAWQASM